MSVKKLQGLQLAFTGNVFVGFSGRTGSVIVGEHEGPELYKFSFQQENGSYKEEWKRQRPQDVHYLCKKYLTDTEDVMVRDDGERATTFLFSNDDMKLISKWQHRGYALLACLPGPRAVYAVTEGGKDYIEIRDHGKEVRQQLLKVDEDSWKRFSVCENDERLAVTDGRLHSSSLDIFSKDGKLRYVYLAETHVESCHY